MWRQARVDILLNHLRTCSLQPDHIKNRAETEHEQRKNQDKTPRANRVAAPSGHGRMQPSMLFVPDPNAPMAPGQPGLHHFPAGVSQQQPTYDQQMFWFDQGSAAGRGEHYSPPGSVGPSDSIGGPTLSRQPSLYSTESDISASSTGTKRRRLASQASHSPTFVPVWSDGQQLAFERGIARITASAGLSLSWVENPEVVAFFQMFLPQGNMPSRGVLTRRIIPQTLEVMQKEV